jgi:uncharacterized protein
MEDNTQSFDELRKKLIESVQFPSVYMYKFICPSNNQTIALVENMFDEDAEISQRPSAKGNYYSITVKKVVMDVEEVIDIYKKASRIPGVMVL